MAHADDAMHYSGDTPMTFCPTGWFGRLFIKTPLMFQPYIGFKPDLLVSGNQTIDLQPFGIPGKVSHTPGHTSGSISVELATKEAMVGDLVASGILLGGIVRKNHAIRPPFEDNPHKVARELQRLLDEGNRRFYMGHGGPLGADEVRRHADYLMRLPKVAEPDHHRIEAQ